MPRSAADKPSACRFEVEVEAGRDGLGIRPCDRCEAGWLLTVASDDGPDLLCPHCGREAALFEVGVGEALP